MKVLELFSGTQSISKQFRLAGHETYCIDNDDYFSDITDLTADILTVRAKHIIKSFGIPDIIWASPPCQTHSISAISHHRTSLNNGFGRTIKERKDSNTLIAKGNAAILHDKVLLKALMLIQELKPKYYFIENPVGGMRRSLLMRGVFYRYTITYCQYGDTRIKPTDIWTNHPDPQFKAMCKNGDSCHVSAPRGSKTGTQGLKNSKERSRIPIEFCNHIVYIIGGKPK